MRKKNEIAILTRKMDSEKINSPAYLALANERAVLIAQQKKDLQDNIKGNNAVTVEELQKNFSDTQYANAQKKTQDEWALKCMLHGTGTALIHEMGISKIEKIQGGLLVVTASGHKFKFQIELLKTEQAAVDSLISRAK